MNSEGRNFVFSYHELETQLWKVLRFDIDFYISITANAIFILGIHGDVSDFSLILIFVGV